MPYYGLYIPVKGGGATASGSTTTTASPAASSGNGAGVVGFTKENVTAESPFVFDTKSKALALLKLHKDARLKEFGEEEDAIKYSQTGFEIVQNKYNDIKTSTAGMEKAAFRAPTKQELIEFRKIIEAGDYERVKQIIWDNPRYLVSSGDTPSTLKEGYRYNAMHICAISKRPQIAELILKTVSDTKFVDLLTGKKNDEKMCQELCVNLLDYYLNIPEKGRSETPLHFASKYGCPEMVEVLTSYSECKMTPNSEGFLPKEIICARVVNPKPEIVQKIKNLFEERYYVPVLRCNDSSMPAQIGHPFSANDPPNLNCSPLTPDVEIKALAGPMTKEKAKEFFHRWKTPPRLGSNVTSPIANNPFISPMKNPRSLPSTPRSSSVANVLNSGFNSPTAMAKRRALFNATPHPKDSVSCPDYNASEQTKILDNTLNDSCQNGNNDKENEKEFLNAIETNNNHHLLNPGLCPRTPLFRIRNDAFISYREQNVDSPIAGLLFDCREQNEFLNTSDIYDSPGFKERHLKNTDTEKGIECIGRNLAKEQNIEWREYWDFLEEFVDIASEQGLQKLETYLGQRQREHEMKNSKRTRHSSDMLEEVCSALEQFGFGGSSTADAMKNARNVETQRTENGLRNSNSFGTASSNLNTSNAHQSSTPYTHVEKSLQVHARRMTKTILHNIDNAVSINDALLLELRRVKSLICSFREDQSFLDVNFEKVHSRIGNLVSVFLLNSHEISVAMKEKILKIFQSILSTPGERREHIECVCSRILYMLENKIDQVLPEKLKTEEMCSKIWSLEKDCDCQWESNLSRKTSRRNRLEARYKNHQRMKQQEMNAKHQDTFSKARNFTEYQNSSVTPVTDLSDEAEEDAFWSDFGGSDTDEEDVWFTPPESRSRLDMTEIIDDDGYKYFIYGNEPTKRDLDVLNAIFHVDVDKARHPTIHSWKTALMRFSNEEMDFFPSPRVVKKSANVTNFGGMPQTPSSSHKPRQLMRSNTASMILAGSPRQHSASLSPSSMTLNQPVVREPILQLPTVKRLFMSPGRSKSMTAAMLPSKTAEDIKKNEMTTPIVVSTPKPLEASEKLQPPRVNNSFLTPLNKLRGLFSSYREQLDDSPMATVFNDRSSNDGSNNSLSLLNISASE